MLLDSSLNPLIEASRVIPVHVKTGDTTTPDLNPGCFDCEHLAYNLNPRLLYYNMLLDGYAVNEDTGAEIEYSISTVVAPGDKGFITFQQNHPVVYRYLYESGRYRFEQRPPADMSFAARIVARIWHNMTDDDDIDMGIPPGEWDVQHLPRSRSASWFNWDLPDGFWVPGNVAILARPNNRIMGVAIDPTMTQVVRRGVGWRLRDINGLWIADRQSYARLIARYPIMQGRQNHGYERLQVPKEEPATPHRGNQPRIPDAIDVNEILRHREEAARMRQAPRQIMVEDDNVFRFRRQT